MSKLLSRAKVYYELSQYNYVRICDDDVYLDACCFMLQQTIEFQLKGIVEINGLRYAENHDIRANLNILNREGIEIPCEKDLRQKATLLYSWETESRYRDSFIAAVKDIEEVMACAATIFDYITSLLSERDPEEIIFPDSKLQ